MQVKSVRKKQTPEHGPWALAHFPHTMLTSRNNYCYYEYIAWHSDICFDSSADAYLRGRRCHNRKFGVTWPDFSSVTYKTCGKY